MSSRFVSVGLNLAAIALGAAALAATIGLSVGVGRALGSDVGDLLTRNTVRLSLLWYAAAVCLMLFLTPADWAAATAGQQTVRWRVARWCWTWGLICFLVHLGMAFHYFHHWSHADAFERTRQLSRFGEGIYVSYLFTVLWSADVAYLWLRPERYAARAVWIDRSLHAFMLFIVLNGTVVFETGAIRWAGLLGLAVLAAAWLVARGGRRAGRAVAERGARDQGQFSELVCDSGTNRKPKRLWYSFRWTIMAWIILAGLIITACDRVNVWIIQAPKDARELPPP